MWRGGFEFNTLLSVNKWLVGEQLIPTADRLKIRVSKPEGTDTYCYTRTQVKRMIEFCPTMKHGNWIRPIIITLATTGMRIGELISLRWNDLDFDANVVHVVDDRFSARKQKMNAVRKTKGKRGRTIPMHPSLRSTLWDLPRHSDSSVFRGPKDGKLRAKTVLDIFKRNVRNKLKAEFPSPAGEVGFERGMIHSFRHYFVSESFRQGATEAEVMDWVGHKASEMVHHYRHLRPDDSQSRMRNIDFLADDNGSSAE